MYFDLYGLYKEISNYNKIYIYGMGMYSEIITPKLYDMGFGSRIAGYVLSAQKPVNQSENGLPVCSIDDLYTDSSDIVFLIATSSKYEHEIADKLKKRNYLHYIFLSHYERDDNRIYFRFEKTDFHQYCSNITAWYEYKYSEMLCGKYLEGHNKIGVEVEKMFNGSNKKLNERNKQQIVFVVTMQHPRMHKIIRALMKKGYEIVVINIDKLIYTDLEYINGEEGSVVCCECIEEILFEAVKYNPLLFYVRPEWLNTSIVNIMLMQRDTFGKIALDIHDIAKGSYNLPAEQEWLYDIEKSALESVDGIVWRYDAQDFLARKYNYSYKGKYIQFWDYCYDEFIYNESGNDDVLRLCCIDAGAECLQPIDDVERGRDGIVRYANLQDILYKIGNREDCKFDLYISTTSNTNMKTLYELKRKYENFNFFIGYPPKRIIQNISRCDYGCSLVHSGRLPTDEECIKKGFYRLSGLYEVGAANRYFDFFNAGIPVVSSCECKRQAEYLKQYGVLVDMTIEDLDIEYLNKNKNFFRNNVKEAEKYLAISAQIDRMIVFFNSL